MSATDLVTVSEASAYLRGPSDASQLASWVSAVSDRLDIECGPIVARAQTVARDGGSSCVIFDAPILSVTSLTEYAQTTAQVLTAETNSTKPSAGYILDTGAPGVIYRRSSGGPALFAPGMQNVVLVASFGRYANTAAVSARFKQAALICVSHLWQAEHGTRTQFGGFEDSGSSVYGPGWAIPRRALDLLAGEVRPRLGIA